MIYKTKTKYKRVENRLGELVAIEDKGNRIIVDGQDFYVNKYLNITEAKTGLRVPYKADSLEEIEMKLIRGLEEINLAIDKYLRLNPGYKLEELKVIKEKDYGKQ